MEQPNSRFHGRDIFREFRNFQISLDTCLEFIKFYSNYFPFKPYSTYRIETTRGAEAERCEYRKICQGSNRFIVKSRQQANLLKFNESVGSAHREWSALKYLLHTKPEPEPTTKEVDQRLCWY